MKTCIINFASGGWYPEGQARLVESLRSVDFDGSTLIFSDERSIGSPTHQAAPYAFKPFALRHAYEMGYELVLWCDASVWAIKPLDGLFTYLAENTHLLFYNCNTGNWSSDASLKSFGITREQAFEMPMLMGICMGWNMTSPLCQEFLRRWIVKATDGVTFPGSWTNKNKEVSEDPRVYGHRHDQTAASIIAHQLNMPLVIAHETFFQYYANPTSTPYAKNPDMSLIRPNVVLVAQGL